MSRPEPGEASYIVVLRDGFDHFVYADSIAKRLNARIGWMYSSFNAFSIHHLDDAAVARLRLFPEVLSVERSTIVHANGARNPR